MSYFKAKMHKIRLLLRLHQNPAGGVYSYPPDPQLYLRSLIFNGETRKRGMGRGREKGRVKGKGNRRGGEGEGPAPKYFGLEPPLPMGGV